MALIKIGDYYSDLPKEGSIIASPDGTVYMIIVTRHSRNYMLFDLETGVITSRTAKSLRDTLDDVPGWRLLAKKEEVVILTDRDLEEIE